MFFGILDTPTFENYLPSGELTWQGNIYCVFSWKIHYIFPLSIFAILSKHGCLKSDWLDHFSRFFNQHVKHQQRKNPINPIIIPQKFEFPTTFPAIHHHKIINPMSTNQVGWFSLGSFTSDDFFSSHPDQPYRDGMSPPLASRVFVPSQVVATPRALEGWELLAPSTGWWWWLVVVQSQQEGSMMCTYGGTLFLPKPLTKGGGNEFLIFGPKTGWRWNDPDLGWNIHFIHWPEKITGDFTAQNSSQLQQFPSPREVNSEHAPISTNSSKWDYRCSISQPTI